MARKKRLKKNQSTHLNVELAADLFLQYKGIKGFFPSYLIGMKPETYLIIKTPVIISDDDLLADGTPLTVRYSHLGDIFKFDTRIIGSNEKPFKVTYLSFPDVIEKIEYRDTQRASCFIPASLVYEKIAIKGMITDISVGGCKFRTDSIDQVEGILVQKEGDVVLQFPLLGLEGIRAFDGTIKKVEFDNDFALGIGFIKMDKETNKIVSSFVEKALEYGNK